MLQTISIRVKGIVQGVYYRQRAKENALKLGVSGEVRNLFDGDVQISATGTEAQLEKFIQWCHKGPETAVVSEVIVEKVPLQTFSSFRILK
jgi:acylphosphatase